MDNYTHKITECGNGFPSDGEYILDQDGCVVLLIKTSMIMTQNSGDGNYVYAVCEEHPDDCDDCECDWPDEDEIENLYDCVQIN